MSGRVVIWTPEMHRDLTGVVAIGVFDGVHVGHQALLRASVAEAESAGVIAIAVTFDRDPDQVVSPESAAPQLLTLADKLTFIGQAAVDQILVVPFTLEVSQMTAECFLDTVLLAAVAPTTVHVGHDFRFGAGASGDVDVLGRTGASAGFEVCAHDLVSVGGAPVTSTRIRGLVAAGDVEAAAELLGRPTRVTGTVHRGRGEGAALGFPTANIAPEPFAALPADGAYAGRALLADGSAWDAAVSVGRPPMFPSATDVLEAHVIGFGGDLYDQPVTVEFLRRLRPQVAYASLEELKSAIAEDVRTTVTQDRPVPDDRPDDDRSGFLADGSPVVEDREALEAAEEAAAHRAPVYFEDIAAGPWVPIIDSVEFNSALGVGWKAFMVASPLDAAGIPYAWDPYPPEERPTALPGGGTYPQPYTLLVPEGLAEDAREVMARALSSGTMLQPDIAAERLTGEVVDDPEALEAAELAVRGIDPETVPRTPSSFEGWASVAADMPYDKRRLGAISYALSAAGIVASWEPFEPGEAPLLRLFGLHETRFSVRVPDEDAEAARQLLAEVDERMARESEG